MHLKPSSAAPRFEVVAVNIDTRDPAKPKQFLNEIGVKKLTRSADPTAKIFTQDLKAIGRPAFGMPTTVLVDGKGCEIATIAGPAEWASAGRHEACQCGDRQSVTSVARVEPTGPARKWPAR